MFYVFSSLSHSSSNTRQILFYRNFDVSRRVELESKVKK